MSIGTRAVCLVVGALAAMGYTQGAATDLLTAARNGSLDGIRAALGSGADPDARDESGASALMRTTAFATPDVMRLLLDRGADVNAANDRGATALMWATTDREKVRLLLDHGADVNAATKDGVTPLLTAAVRGNVDVMRQLVAAGADLRAGTMAAPWPMRLTQIARTTNDEALRAFVQSLSGLPQEEPPGAPPLLTSWLLTRAFSWRPQPAPSDSGLVRLLLDAGADPNESVAQLASTFPALARAVRLGDVDSIHVLLDRGADPNLAGSGGVTPLMMAGATTPDAAMVQLLLDRGAKVSAEDADGNSALDWALRLGDTEASRTLRRAGAVRTAPVMALPPAVSQPRAPREAIELALARLQPAGPAFYNRTKCISCHNQSLPSIAVALVRAHGLTVDETLAGHPRQATLTVWRLSRENMLLGNCSVFGFLGNVTYGLFGLAEEGAPSTPETDAVVSCLSGLQEPDGSWKGGDVRPPLAGPNALVYTSLAARALSAYAPPGLHAEMTERIADARAYLRKTAAEDTQGEAFKLLGLVWTSAPAVEIARQADRLLARQRDDGGWSQLPKMSSDAYASGEALFALQTAGVEASSAAYRKGVGYLLATQLDDGTWYVRSRAIGFQPYVDSGFPHGPDQFISAAATSWAVIALSRASWTSTPEAGPVRYNP